MAHPLPVLTPYSPYQFALVRIGLGLYLVAHCAALMPHAWALYGPQGLLPPEHAAPFPSVLGYFDSRASLDGFLAAMMVLALAYAAGIERRVTAVLLWYGWACLVSRSPYLLVPHDGYVGWLLLATSLVPGREPLSLSRRGGQFWMPPTLYWGAWVVMATAYSISGIFKLESPSWRDGEAVRFVLECPFARLGWLRDALLSAPNGALHAATWGTLALEVLYLPLCLHGQTRRVVWTAMVGLHLVVLLVIDIASVSVAMLLAHLFTMDALWVPKEAAGLWSSLWRRDRVRAVARTE
jgi:hypothetical protein